MYLDFLGNKNINARVGNFLMPMGLINEQHEPTLFTTVQRPKTSYYIIPSTWNQSGVMAYGSILDGVEYKAGVVTAMKTDGTTGDKWFRDGRSRGFKIKNVEYAGVARLDYTGTNGLLVGASVYGDEDILLWDVHADYKVGAARFYGTYASNNRSNTTANTAEATESFGGYLNASYDMLSFIDSEYKMPLFVQYEVFNAQSAVSNGGIANDDTKNTSIGINFFPLEQVVLKADYVISKTGDINSNTSSVSMGFLF
ncbi:hypothetical protein MNB_SM-4-1575 [hydrothermal vent metagenome]|uniref:Porin n=1 Tax=hydrothermal vent metagenome TaxID=652676 RepID=A0A1W1CSH5_9ZZZZ